MTRQVGPRLDPGQRRRLDAEPERRGQPDGADHPQGVLLEARPGVTDRPQPARLDVRQATERIEERRRAARLRPPRHRIDREVAAGQVQLDAVAELDAVRPPEVGVVVVGPERRDLEDLVVVPDGDRAEPVLVDGIREERDDRSGNAPDARSQSCGRRPRTTSRSDPPTTYAA